MKTAWIHASLLDGTENMTLRPDTTVVVEDGKIVEIAQGAPAPRGARVYDLAGKYLLPGLINAHVHLPGNGKPRKKKMDAAKTARLVMSTALTRKILVKMCQDAARMQLMSGVTTLRTVGGVGRADTIVRDRIASGRAVGPRVLASNNAVTVAGGHMAGSVAYAARSAEDAVAKVREVAAQGTDLIKLMITGGVLDAEKPGEPGLLRMPAEYVKACCDEAHRLGMKVAAHVESAAGAKVAAANGVDTLEHGAPLDQEDVANMLARRAGVVATFSPVVPFLYVDDALTNGDALSRLNSQVVADGMVQSAKLAMELGMPLGLGTDTGCPLVTHYDMWRELAYARKFLGISAAKALYLGTLSTARLLGLGEITGSLEVGKAADMIVSAANPLEDFRALSRLEMVVSMGKVYEHPTVKKYPVVEEALDKAMDMLGCAR